MACYGFKNLLNPFEAHNSCGADIVVFVALQLNIGISNIEQMGERGIYTLSIPALTLRNIILRAQGQMAKEGRMALIARFRDDLSYCDSTNFQVGVMCDVRDLMFLAFHSSLAFCWHESTSTTCCDGATYYGTTQRVLTISHVGFYKHHQLANAISQFQYQIRCNTGLLRRRYRVETNVVIGMAVLSRRSAKDQQLIGCQPFSSLNITRMLLRINPFVTATLLTTSPLYTIQRRIKEREGELE